MDFVLNINEKLGNFSRFLMACVCYVSSSFTIDCSQLGICVVRWIFTKG